MTAGGGVVVVGCGVAGLTTATLLAEEGRDVTVVAADGWRSTTSRVAGAVWEPYLSAGPDLLRWAVVTHRRLCGLAARGIPGVRVGPLVDGGVGAHPTPDWALAVGGVERLEAADLPTGWDSGFRLEVPIVDMGRYLPWLVDGLRDRGVTFAGRRLASLDELAPVGVVANCTGLGARRLVGDDSVRPVRGQVVVVANPGLHGALIQEDPGAAVTYAIAHSHEVVLGGTADVGDESLEPDAATAAAIVERAGHLDPRLRLARVVGHRVGLRPWRPEIRLEVDAAPPPGVGRVVHNYGHGGSGLTLSWGCAADAVALCR